MKNIPLILPVLLAVLLLPGCFTAPRALASDNPLDETALVSKSPEEIMLDRGELRSYWLQRGADGQFVHEVNISEFERVMPGESGISLGAKNGYDPSARKGYVLLLSLWEFDNLSAAEDAFDEWQGDLGEMFDPAEDRITVGNEMFTGVGNESGYIYERDGKRYYSNVYDPTGRLGTLVKNDHRIYLISFRRNNVIVNGAVDSYLDEESHDALEQEIEDYLITLDNRII